MERETFTKLVLEAEHTLYRVAKTILREEQDCEDAVQEAILKAYQKLDSLREPQFFRTWLVRILINECYRIRRSARPTVNYEEYLETAPSNGADTCVWEAIRDLPEPLRLPVELCYVEGYTVAEVQSILHIPAGTVKSRLYRARKVLRTTLESEVSL